MSFAPREARGIRSALNAPGVATLAGLVVVLMLPGVAMAWRSPTPRERSEIVRAARSANGSRRESVRVRDIRVARTSPWATAVITIYRRGTASVEQAEQATFYKAHGSWVDSASAKAPDLAMPPAVERDLGLTRTSRSGPLAFEIYLYVCWFFGLAAIWDVLLQPRRAFRAAGHSKARWLVIESVGAVVTGVFTWAYYAIRIRPAVVRAGGRPARTGLKAFFGALAELAEESSRAVGSSGPPRKPASHAYPWDVPRHHCSRCAGHGRRSCDNCHGQRGALGTNPNDVGGPLIWFSCRACNGAGDHECDVCDGRGWTS